MLELGSIPIHGLALSEAFPIACVRRLPLFERSAHLTRRRTAPLQHSFIGIRRPMRSLGKTLGHGNPGRPI